MGANKITLNTPDGEEVLIDLTRDTVTPETLAEGATAHDASGEEITGTMPTDVVRYGAQTLTDAQKAQARANIDAASADEVADLNVRIGQQHLLFAEGETVEEALAWLAENGDTTKVYVLPDGFFYEYKQTIVEGNAPTHTNILPLAVNTDGSPYVGLNGEKGYKTDYRLNSSLAEVAQSGMCCTGYLPITPGATGVLRFKNITVSGTKGGYIYAYKSDFSSGVGANSAFETTLSNSYDATSGVYTITLGQTAGTNGVTIGGFSGLNQAHYLRVSIGNINENTIITWNEEITEGGGTEIIETWASTGQAFVPTDYDGQIANLTNITDAQTKAIAELQEAFETGNIGELTEAEKIQKIKTWDKPVYDSAPVTLIADSRVKPALTTSDRSISAIYAKYRALMAAYPRYITETNLGACTSSSTFSAVDMLRFDIKEPDGITDTNTPSSRHETKPKIIFMSGVHTEWVGVWGLYYAIEEIVTNPDFDDIRRNAHIIVVPCSNPFVLSNQTVSGWTTTHVNANGVAIHNNFGVDHSTSGTVGEYNYGGSTPYSELETQYIDKIMADNPDAVAFVSCHNCDYDTYHGAPIIWASSATYHMCNVVFRLIDKISKAWVNKYGDTLKAAIDEYKTNMDDGDYRLGFTSMSTSAGTEQKNALKYGIQGVNVEITRMMKVFSGNTDGTSEVMTHGAEVYANLMRTLLAAYSYTDKEAYYK